MNKRIGALIATLAFLWASDDHSTTRMEMIGTPVFAAPNLTELTGVDELRTLFNRDAGKVRLVLLISPT